MLEVLLLGATTTKVSSSGGGTGILVIFLLIVLAAWIGFTQVQARKQSQIPTTLGKIRVQQIIDEVFGRTWKRITGPGDVNVRPTFKRNAPTISIGVEPLPSGGTEVSVWLSQWGRRLGMVEHAQLVWRKKRALAARLQAAGGVATQPAAAGVPPSAAPRTPVIGMPLAAAPAAPAGSAAAHTTPPTDGKEARPSAGQSVSRAEDAAERTARRARTEAASKLGPVGQLVASSAETIVVRTGKTPQQIANVLRHAVEGVLPGSDSHFVLGPPRATFWAHVTEGGNERFLALSLVTPKADEASVSEMERKVSAVVAPGLDGVVTILHGLGEDPQLEQQLAGSTVVSIAGLS